MLQLPTEQNIFNYTSNTHAIDKVSLDGTQIMNTWHKKGIPNPYAQGHFRAFMYIMYTLLPSADFPMKEGAALNNLRDSDTALFWLRELHHKMADPLVNHPLLDDDSNAPTPILIGRYRINPSMAVTKPTPPPELIPKLMHNWLQHYANFHNQIKNKVDNPYAFSQELGIEVHRKAYETNLFFCTVQPLACLNQRMGRFIENTLRLAWRLPIKLYGATSKEFSNLHRDIEDYQNSTVPKLVNAANELRF